MPRKKKIKEDKPETVQLIAPYEQTVGGRRVPAGGIITAPGDIRSFEVTAYIKAGWMPVEKPSMEADDNGESERPS